MGGGSKGPLCAHFGRNAVVAASVVGKSIFPKVWRIASGVRSWCRNQADRVKTPCRKGTGHHLRSAGPAPMTYASCEAAAGECILRAVRTLLSIHTICKRSAPHNQYSGERVYVPAMLVSTSRQLVMQAFQRRRPHRAGSRRRSPDPAQAVAAFDGADDLLDPTTHMPHLGIVSPQASLRVWGRPKCPYARRAECRRELGWWPFRPATRRREALS